MKKGLSLILALTLCLGLAAPALAAGSGGKCGKNLTWSLGADGTLNISGAGPTDDFDYDDEQETTTAPWSAQREKITSVVIDKGVTGIGEGAFYGCEALTDIYYYGSESEWKLIRINKKNNGPLLAAKLHYAGDGSISVTVNGKAVAWPDAAPFVNEDGRTMVPLRAVADAMGLRVVWYDAENEAAFTDGAKVIYFPIGSSSAPVSGGGIVKMDTAAVLENDRTYAPARYLAEYFGYTVDWDGWSNTVIITKGNSEDFVCGSTEPHQWKAANYQAPETCAVCGATRGSALTPDFVTYGIRTDLEVGKHYDFETICYSDPGVKTRGDLTVLNYSVFRSDAAHKAKDGYEWRAAAFRLLFRDENARRYGAFPGTPREDYYDVRLNDDSAMYNGNGDAATFTVNYYGEERECFFLLESPAGEWQGDTYSLSFRVSVRVPVGYDGCVFGVRDRAVEYPGGGYIFDIYDPGAFFLFRLA